MRLVEDGRVLGGLSSGEEPWLYTVWSGGEMPAEPEVRKGDLFAKTNAKSMAQSGPQKPEGGDDTGPALSEGYGAPLTRAFMEQLFGSLCEDFAMLKRDIAADIKDLKKEMIDLGQRMDSVEQTQDVREEELDCHRRELLTLQDKNQDLQYQLEDLENRSRRSNIRLKGIPAKAVTGSLEDFVVRLFRHVAPSLKEQDIVLDKRTGRAELLALRDRLKTY
ncbi:hypothetical protein NDU88_001518 [Pleurodeles waltl]|uniref:Uncharacterized protein n=1 Tax=Pleurodeles waltl TaxID=8319 RepID=A0AAV7V8J2_PLEWA|nr:hypothetical protein NDU88_001518 [Pleurodeles waltl]